MAYTDNYTIVDGLMDACDSDEQFIRLSEIFQFNEALFFRVATPESPASYTLSHLYEQVAETDSDLKVLAKVFG